MLFYPWVGGGRKAKWQYTLHVNSYMLSKLAMDDCCIWWTSTRRRCCPFYSVVRTCLHPGKKQLWRRVVPKTASCPGWPLSSLYVLLCPPSCREPLYFYKTSHPWKDSHNFRVCSYSIHPSWVFIVWGQNIHLPVTLTLYCLQIRRKMDNAKWY